MFELAQPRKPALSIENPGVGKLNSWGDELDVAVNQRVLSTGEPGEFAGENRS